MSGTLQVGGITLGTHNSGTGKVDLTNAGATTVTTLNTTSIASGAIGSNVTIADGASPHGWQHIGTKHYNTDTSPTDTSYFPLVNEAGSTLTVSSEFSAYKIYFQLSNTAGDKNLYLRL